MQVSLRPISRLPKRHVAVAFMVLALAAGVAAACGSDSGDQAQIEQLQAQLETQQEEQEAAGQASQDEKRQLEDQISELQEQQEDLQAQLDTQLEEFSSLQERVDLLQGATLAGESGTPEELANRLDADRLLLLDFRKDLPEDEDDARAFWANIKALAARSDPSLAPLVDRVARTVPNYFRFVNQDFTSTLEAQLSYQLLAADYDTAKDEFWNSFMTVLSDRLDSLARLAVSQQQ
ncbi:MAG: hypothetical protein IIC82_01195 [Chloroflexi bacterium]|nr:hypothetical protein [Chloroflexota bacterium]